MLYLEIIIYLNEGTFHHCVCIMQECWTIHTIGSIFAVGNVMGHGRIIYMPMLMSELCLAITPHLFNILTETVSIDRIIEVVSSGNINCTICMKSLENFCSQKVHIYKGFCLSTQHVVLLVATVWYQQYYCFPLKPSFTYC